MTSRRLLNIPSNADTTLPWGYIPQYSDFMPGKVEGMFDKLKSLYERLEKEVLEPLEAIPPSEITWEKLIVPLEIIIAEQEVTWSPLDQLSNLRNTPALRETQAKVLPLRVAFGLRLSQSRPVYQLVKHLRENDKSLTDAQKRILDKRIVNAEVEGIALDGEKKARFNEIARLLGDLSKKFNENVIDSTKAWSLVVDLKANPEYHEVATSVPRDLLVQASTRYNTDNPNLAEPATPEKGPWTFTCDIPSYIAFIENCTVRALRQKMHEGYYTLASSGVHDNRPLILEILALRREKAALLGLKDFSEISLAKKMARTSTEIETLLERLRQVSLEAGKKEFKDLEELASKEGIDSVMHWDTSFLAKRLEELKYEFKEEEVRPYLPYDNVLAGFLKFVSDLFSIEVREENDERIPKWHEDVKFYLIHNRDRETGKPDETPMAGFFLDPYVRPGEKRGGAWVDQCRRPEVDRVTGKKIQIPIAYVILNSPAPTAEIPSLLSVREAETLFHEFGHALQVLLTEVYDSDVAGFNGIEWDAVELPSQFMENWFYYKPTFMSLTSHYKTGEKLSEEIFEKIEKARTFRAASLMLRQLRFGLIDLKLHTKFAGTTNDELTALQKEVTAMCEVLPMAPYDNGLCTFGHIFAGGYACGYYSYKWAEVLSADAFQVFLDHGIENEKEVKRLGRKFRDTVLALGGSVDPAEVFIKFKGSKPDPDSLLKQQHLL